MKNANWIAFTILITFALITSSGCGGQKFEFTPSPTAIMPTARFSPTLLPSSTPTITPAPTATPTPIGGGGTIFIGVNKLLVPKELNLDQPFNWFSSLSDGSNLTPLDVEIYSISPDNKRMLVHKDGALTLMNPDGSNAVELATDNETYVGGSRDNTFRSYLHSVLWLPNGSLVFLTTKQHVTRHSFYAANSDGSGLTKLEQPSKQIGEVSSLLFASLDGKAFYWATGNPCRERGLCNERYFFSKVDDSDQQQIWKGIKNASDNIYLSPSGHFIAYGAFFSSSPSEIGCYLANVAGETLTKIEVHGSSDCFRENPWSPIENKILLESIVGEGENAKHYYDIWTAPDGSVTTFSYDDVYWQFPHWMPDGNHLLLAVPSDIAKYTQSGTHSASEKSLGDRIINISDGKITEYPYFGFCKHVLSPDAKWALLYACVNTEHLIVYPSQLINLETKEAFPVFSSFVSNDPMALVRGWVTFWIP